MNGTPLSAQQPAVQNGVSVVLPGQTPDGEYILSVLLKRSYQFQAGGSATRMEKDTPLESADIHWGDPTSSTVEYESDFVPYKLATDVALNATAYAPGASPTGSFIAAVRIGETKKLVQIFGQRFARYSSGGIPSISEPEPVTQSELRYENAYGGIDIYSHEKTHYPYPNNVLGKGFVVSNTDKTLNNLELPTQEDPANLLTAERLCINDYEQWEHQPAPSSFGWCPRGSWLRAQHAGVLPADKEFELKLRAEYAKLLSGDEKQAYLDNPLPVMDFKYFSGASTGLNIPYMQGGELVETVNLSTQGKLNFHLPDDRPVIGLDIGKGFVEKDVVRQTVHIDMDQQTVQVVWRMAVAYDGPEWLPEMTKMDVQVE